MYQPKTSTKVGKYVNKYEYFSLTKLDKLQYKS